MSPAKPELFANHRLACHGGFERGPRDCLDINVQFFDKPNRKGLEFREGKIRNHTGIVS
jgi:hypothetical protein